LIHHQQKGSYRAVFPHIPIPTCASCSAWGLGCPRGLRPDLGRRLHLRFVQVCSSLHGQEAAEKNRGEKHVIDHQLLLITAIIDVWG
jgi:hypothetical protein